MSSIRLPRQKVYVGKARRRKPRGSRFPSTSRRRSRARSSPHVFSLLMNWRVERIWPPPRGWGQFRHTVGGHKAECVDAETGLLLISTASCIGQRERVGKAEMTRMRPKTRSKSGLFLLLISTIRKKSKATKKEAEAIPFNSGQLLLLPQFWLPPHFLFLFCCCFRPPLFACPKLMASAA